METCRTCNKVKIESTPYGDYMVCTLMNKCVEETKENTKWLRCPQWEGEPYSIKIWLDDVRTPPSEGWTWCKTVNEVEAMIALNNKYCTIEVLSLDNDLGEGKDEGYKVLDWLEEKKFHTLNFIVPKKIQVHSANPVARRRMEQIIEKNGWK